MTTAHSGYRVALLGLRFIVARFDSLAGGDLLIQHSAAANHMSDYRFIYSPWLGPCTANLHEDFNV